MLKVMKYDWKNGWNSIRGILLLAAVLAALAGYVMRTFDTSTIGFLWFAVMTAMLVLTVRAIFRNMSDRMFGPEGYLTHTLPVDTWELLLGKAAGTWLFGVFMVIAAVICWFLLLLCDIGTSVLGDSLMMVIEALPKLGGYHFQQLAIGMRYLVSGILAFLVISFLLIVQLQFICIAARLFGKFHIAGGIIVFLILVFVEASWDQSMAMGFLIVLLCTAVCFAGSHWLLKHCLHI